MAFGLHVKYLLILSDFNETSIFCTDLKKSSNIKFHKNWFGGSRIVPCGGTDMTKVTAAFRNFANASKNSTWNANYVVSRTNNQDKRFYCIIRRAFSVSCLS
jgi:hypothetical protein